MRSSLGPIFTLELYPEIRAALLTLLDSLTLEEWERQTLCCPGWSVKDMAAHMLADDVGMLSSLRDGYRLPIDLDLSDWDTLVGFLNDRNEQWVQAARRLSPRLVRELLAISGAALDAYLATVDPFMPWTVVDWAGSEPAPAWMEIARDYTEYWTHQQHIRDTVGQPGLKEPRYFAPVLEAFMRALPRTYRHVQADEGTHIRVIVSGEAGNTWSLLREDGAWRLYRSVDTPATAQVTLDAETTWRLFTKGMDASTARRTSTVEGDASLGNVVFETVSIIA